MSRPVLRPNVPESLRPLAGVFVAVALVLTMLGVVGPAQAARVAVPDPIAHYPLTKTTGINDVVGGKHGMLHYQDPNTITWDDGLTLASTSSAGPYASFPADLVSGNESVTISTWIKRDVPTGNYSAMFYGEAPNAQKRPVHYWLLNPSQPQGYFKSVFTNGTVTDQPWTTEVGPASSADSASTAHLRNSWAAYTTVITHDPGLPQRQARRRPGREDLRAHGLHEPPVPPGQVELHGRQDVQRVLPRPARVRPGAQRGGDRMGA